MDSNGGKVTPERLYDPEWWVQTIERGIPLSFRSEELPLEEILALDECAHQYPGLRFNLRKQRGKYLLTILPPRHIGEENARGEP